METLVELGITALCAAGAVLAIVLVLAALISAYDWWVRFCYRGWKEDHPRHRPYFVHSNGQTERCDLCLKEDLKSYTELITAIGREIAKQKGP